MSIIHVKKRNGRLENLNVDKINKVVERACQGLEDVSSSEIVLDAKLQFFDKITTTEIDNALIMTASDKVDKDPNYAYVAARLQLNCLYKEVFGEGIDADTFELLYRKSFITNTKKLVKENRLDSRLLDFDLKRLSSAIVWDRDDLFKYLGIKILTDRYFIKLDGRRMETPQAFWMRVAMGLAINEADKNEKAIEFYNMLSTFRMSCSTPTLFNSGTTHSQLSSCFLNTFEDSIDGIFDGLRQEAHKSKYAGGLGFDVTPFRATGSYIRGTDGSSSGLIPWLKLYNDMLIAVNQGGRRNGSGCAYLEPWHLDVEEFIDLRKATGEERRRTHDMNTALWMNDLLMERIEQDGDWYLFDPAEATHLHEMYGDDFRTAYLDLCNIADAGGLKMFKKIRAKDLWKKILKSIFETSHPWITFKDPSNMRYTNSHEGVVHSSNLCTEITLHTKPSTYDGRGNKVETGETAVCNLASINLKNHVKYGQFDTEIDWVKLGETVETAIRMLDNVIDINFYPTEETKKSNQRHRPIGLGVMGFHDVCHMRNIQIDTNEGVELTDRIQEFISAAAILASSKLAKERGTYASYEGSKWSKGEFPYDTWKASNLIRFGETLSVSGHQDWTPIYNHVKEFGMRNSNVMAIAPTATISYIQGCEQSIEPNFTVFFTYENTSGGTYISNEYFVRDMKKLGLWSTSFAEQVKAVDGDVSFLDIPQQYKDKYKIAFNRDMFKLIEGAGRRQKWIDMGQSFNFWNNKTSLKYFNDLYMHAHKHGLKSTYYFRSPSASKVEKSTTTANKKNESPEVITEKVCSLEARMRGEVCESCQ